MGFFDSFTKPFKSVVSAATGAVAGAVGLGKSVASEVLNDAKDLRDDAKDFLKGVAHAPTAALDFGKWIPYLLVGGLVIAGIGLIKNPGAVTAVASRR